MHRVAPWTFRCFHKVHRPDASFPNTGCCAYLDTLATHEERYTKQLVIRKKSHADWKAAAQA